MFRVCSLTLEYWSLCNLFPMTIHQLLVMGVMRTPSKHDHLCPIYGKAIHSVSQQICLDSWVFVVVQWVRNNYNGVHAAVLHLYKRNTLQTQSFKYPSWGLTSSYMQHPSMPTEHEFTNFVLNRWISTCTMLAYNKKAGWLPQQYSLSKCYLALKMTIIRWKFWWEPSICWLD